MTLIKSISGIRGTIGGVPGESLTPIDTVKFAAGYGRWLKETHTGSAKVVIGRDARISGKMVSQLVCSTLQGMGVDVLDIGLATTPTVEMAVVGEGAQGGIILTASHNPIEWNALKLLNDKGEFISAEDGAQVLAFAEDEDLSFSSIHEIGTYQRDKGHLDKHIADILALPLVDKDLVASMRFKVAVDAVNSIGGLAVPALLKALGVAEVKELFCEPTGHFPHNPEPLPENLIEIQGVLESGAYDLGIVVDPDVDRLALIMENGQPFGEEYTLVAVSDYVLSITPGNTVSNLSSTRALRDVTEGHDQTYKASAVGEVKVVEQMKATNAVIGGEGNGGIIYPALHYGRDALVGIALFLTHLAKSKMKVSELRAKYPDYHISKNKIELTPDIDVDKVLEGVKSEFSDQKIITIDGVKIEFEKEWVHLRKSNTEPIIRIYAESSDADKAEALAKSVIDKINYIVKTQ